MTTISTPNHFGGACANCKWRDHAGRCSVRDGQADDTDESGSLDDDRLGRDLEAGPAGDGGQHVQALSVVLDSSVDNPIIL